MTSGPVQASVIVAALNAAEHIEEQLLALARQQTEVSWELIVADNGSTDGTLAIVDRCASQFRVPVRLVDASERRGVSAARNAGVAAAAGEFLLFTDADDVVDECWVEEMVSALREHRFVGGQVEVLELNGEEVASWRMALGQTDLPLLGGCPRVIGCNFGCRDAALAAVGGFDEAAVHSEDLDLSFKMRAHGITAVFAERAVVHYRYRREPLKAIRQAWNYGVSGASLYARYEVVPPTFLDGLIALYRGLKQAVREALRGRRPVRPAVDIAYVLGEASIVWREPAFWQPVPRRYRIANPLIVCGDRLARLASLVSASPRTRRG